MKTALALLLSCAALSLAQDVKVAPQTQESSPAQAAPPAQAGPDSQQFKRLASVTWDLGSHKLVWVVERGVEMNGTFVAMTADRYEVSPGEAFMALKDEKRGIDDEEASSLHDLLGVLSLYCVESTVWWENGGNAATGPAAADPAAPQVEAKPGKKTGDEKSAPAADPAAKPTRVGEPGEKSPSQLLPGQLVAANGLGK